MGARHNFAAFDHRRARHHTAFTETVSDDAENLMRVDEVISWEVWKMNCPECGAEMDKGYLQAGPSVWAGVFWVDGSMEDKTRFSVKKERITTFLPVNFPGFRCPKCKMITIRYALERKEEGG